MNIFTSSHGFVKINDLVQKAVTKQGTVYNYATFERPTLTGK